MVKITLAVGQKRKPREILISGKFVMIRFENSVVETFYRKED